MLLHGLKGYSTDMHLTKHSVCSGSYKCTGLQIFISQEHLVYGFPAVFIPYSLTDYLVFGVYVQTLRMP